MGLKNNNNNNSNRNSWYMAEMANELTQEIGRRITTIMKDTREKIFLFQRLSMALQRGNAVSFQQHHANRVNCRCNHNFVCLAWFSCLRLCAGGLKIIMIIIIIQI